MPEPLSLSFSPLDMSSTTIFNPYGNGLYQPAGLVFGDPRNDFTVTTSKPGSKTMNTRIVAVWEKDSPDGDATTMSRISLDMVLRVPTDGSFTNVDAMAFAYARATLLGQQSFIDKAINGYQF